MSKFLKRFAADPSGATPVQYSVMIGVMALIVIGCASCLGMHVGL